MIVVCPLSKPLSRSSLTIAIVSAICDTSAQPSVRPSTLPPGASHYCRPPTRPPPSSSHTDLTDIFVVQLDGFKHWEAFYSPVFLTTHHPYRNELTSQDSTSTEAENQTFLTATLAPGDTLYLPAHWVHKANTLQPAERPDGPNTNRVTSSTGSLHLTITPKTQLYRIDALLDNVLEVLPTYMQVNLSPSSYGLRL